MRKLEMVLAFLVAILAAFAAGAAAQTVHYSGAQYQAQGNIPFQVNAVAIDASGNIYVSDPVHNTVWKETPGAEPFSYTSSTVWSTPSGAPSAVAVDASQNVYIAEQSNNVVFEVPLTASGYGPAVTISTPGLVAPKGLAVDQNGNLYVDNGSSSGVVLKETLSNGSYTQSTIATGLNNPNQIAVDSDDNVYIADTLNNRIVKETPSGTSYVQSTVGTGLNQPFGVTVDSSGNDYIVQGPDGLVYKETFSNGSYTQSAMAPGASVVSQADRRLFIAA